MCQISLKRDSDLYKKEIQTSAKKGLDLHEKHPNNNKTDRNKTDIMGSACVNSISVEQFVHELKNRGKSVTFFKVMFEMNTGI